MTSAPCSSSAATRPCGGARRGRSVHPGSAGARAAHQRTRRGARRRAPRRVARQRQRRHRGAARVGPLFETVPTDPAAWRGCARTSWRTRSTAGAWFPATGRPPRSSPTSIDSSGNRQFVARRLSETILAIAEQERGDAQIFITGAPHVKVVLAETLLAEMRVILPAILAVAALLSLFAFRTLRGVALVAASIAIALIWTLGAGPQWRIAQPGQQHRPAADHARLRARLSTSCRNTTSRCASCGWLGRRARWRGRTRARGNGSRRGGERVAPPRLASCRSPRAACRRSANWDLVGTGVATTVVALTFLPAAWSGPHDACCSPPRAAAGDAIAEGLRRRWHLRGRDRAARRFARRRHALARRQRLRLQLRGRRAGTRRRPGHARLGGANAFMIVVDADEDYAFARARTSRRCATSRTARSASGDRRHDVRSPMFATLSGLPRERPAGRCDPRGGAVTSLLLRRRRRDAWLRRQEAAQRLRAGRAGGAPTAHRRTPRAAPARAAGARHRRARAARARSTRSRAVRSRASGWRCSLIYLTLSALLLSFRIGLIALLPNLLPIAIYYGVLDSSTCRWVWRLSARLRRHRRRRHRALLHALHARRRRRGRGHRGGTALGDPSGHLHHDRPRLASSFSASPNCARRCSSSSAAFTLAVAWMLELTLLAASLCSSLRLVTLAVASISASTPNVRSRSSRASRAEARIFAPTWWRSRPARGSAPRASRRRHVRGDRRRGRGDARTARSRPRRTRADAARDRRRKSGRSARPTWTSSPPRACCASTTPISSVSATCASPRRWNRNLARLLAVRVRNNAARVA